VSAVFRLRGEVDLASVPGLTESLHRFIGWSGDDVVVDCAELDFIDSSGIAVLLDARATLDAHGRALRMVNLRNPGRRAIEVLGLIEHLGVTQLPSMADGSTA
jgi:anti-sigma B factor antagonist